MRAQGAGWQVMMKMKIADSCKPSMKWFGLDQWTVRRTVTMPDEKSVVRTHGGTVIGFYEKDHRGQRVMAIRYQHAGKDYVNMVFVVPPTIDSQPTPLDTVREVRIGTTTALWTREAR